MIFNLGFSPWWSSYYPDDYYGSGLPDPGYNSPYSAYDIPYSYNYDPGDYQGDMYYDQNSYPDQSQGYYDSTVYQTEAYDDPNGYSDESQSDDSTIDDSTIVAAQERLGRQGYYRGETDGVLSAEMQKALRRYQSTNGLRQTGDLDSDTLAVMGLSKITTY